MTVRFLNNFIITVTQTILDDAGRLTVAENTFHVGMGDVHVISHYEPRAGGRVDIHFPDSSRFAGVARNVEGDYCELHQPQTTPKVSNPGCGGCKKNK